MNRTYRVMGLLLILLSIVVQSGLSAVAEAKPVVTTPQTESRVRPNSKMAASKTGSPVGPLSTATGSLGT